MPRGVFVDLDPTAVDEVRTYTYCQFFHYEQLISRNEDVATNFATSSFTTCRDVVDLVLDRIRKLVDICTDWHGFRIFHACGRGSGSGLGCLRLERWSSDHGKNSKHSFAAWACLPDVADDLVARRIRR